MSASITHNSSGYVQENVSHFLNTNYKARTQLSWDNSMPPFATISYPRQTDSEHLSYPCSRNLTGFNLLMNKSGAFYLTSDSFAKINGSTTPLSTLFLFSIHRTTQICQGNFSSSISPGDQALINTVCYQTSLLLSVFCLSQEILTKFSIAGYLQTCTRLVCHTLSKLLLQAVMRIRAVFSGFGFDLTANIRIRIRIRIQIRIRIRQ